MMKKIAFLTDTHLGQRLILKNNEVNSTKMFYQNEVEEHKENLKIVLDDIAKKGISDIVFGGDIGSKESNKWFFETINTYNFKYQIILGNHDTFIEVSKHYTNDLVFDTEEMKYVDEDTYFKYIYLDTSSNSISKRQLQWLKDNLNTDKKIILFLHHPILKINALIDDIGAALNRRDEIKKLLLETKKEVTIFCGHYHMEEKTIEENIEQFSTIACSYQIEKQLESIDINDRIFGYRIITIYDKHINTELIAFNRLIM